LLDGDILNSRTLKGRMPPKHNQAGTLAWQLTGSSHTWIPSARRSRGFLRNLRTQTGHEPTAFVWSLAGGTPMGPSDRATREAKLRGYGWKVKAIESSMRCRGRVPTHLQLTRQQRLNAAARPCPWRSCSRIRRGSSERGRTIPRSALGQSAGDCAATCHETAIYYRPEVPRTLESTAHTVSQHGAATHGRRGRTGVRGTFVPSDTKTRSWLKLSSGTASPAQGTTRTPNGRVAREVWSPDSRIAEESNHRTKPCWAPLSAQWKCLAKRLYVGPGSESGSGVGR